MSLSTLKIYQQRFNSLFPEYLPNNQSHLGNIYDAMQYSFFVGGKRIRPALVYSFADSLNIPLEKVDAVAMAVESIHTYSLIHDDLPDMDNDDTRRGSPTCHKKFNNFTAILAGDALNTLAFEILANDTEIESSKRLKQISLLAHGAGVNGMIGGQDTDLNCESRDSLIDIDTLSTLHQGKTAKLIEAALLMCYYSLDRVQDKYINQLSTIAMKLGLLYQIQDDILEATQTTEILGKSNASDVDKQKSTYVSLLGLDMAIKTSQQLSDELIQCLADFFMPRDYHKTTFASVITYILKRDY